MNRLFVAIKIPDVIKSRLNALQSGFPGLRWTTPATLHLTIKFIGEVQDDLLKNIRESLRNVNFGPFSLKVAGLGLFKREKGAILWAGISGDDSLQRLKRGVDGALCGVGVGVGKGTYTPHITLCRIKLAATPQLRKAVDGGKFENFGEFSVDRFILHRSQLLPGGAAHETIEEYAAR